MLDFPLWQTAPALDTIPIKHPQQIEKCELFSLAHSLGLSFLLSISLYILTLSLFPLTFCSFGSVLSFVTSLTFVCKSIWYILFSIHAWLHRIQEVMKNWNISHFSPEFSCSNLWSIIWSYISRCDMILRQIISFFFRKNCFSQKM